VRNQQALPAIPLICSLKMSSAFWMPWRIQKRSSWVTIGEKVLPRTSLPDIRKRLAVLSDADLGQYKESWIKKGALIAMLNWYRAAILSPSQRAVDPEASRVKVPALLI